MSNDEPIAIVTGADSGIGLAIATKFAEAEKIGKSGGRSRGSEAGLFAVKLGDVAALINLVYQAGIHRIFRPG